MSADHGTVVDHGDGTYSITPDANYEGIVHLSYDVSTGIGASAAATESFVVTDPSLIGTTGNDLLIGSSGTDYFAGGNGADTIVGGSDTNTFVWAAGDGNDIIQAKGTADTLAFQGTITASDLIIASNTDDQNLHIKVIPTGEEITVQYHFADPSFQLEQITFGNGTSLDLSQINDLADHNFIGTDGNDLLVGSPGNDSLYGGLGDDTMVGNAGDDTFFYNPGDGNDVIQAKEGNDTLAFQGNITASDLIIASNPDDQDLHIKVLSTGADITVQYHFVDAADQLENITFGNGSSLNLSQINDLAAHTILGNAGSELLVDNNTGSNTFYGGLGDDTLVGGSDTNTFVWNEGDGNDVIQAKGTSDTLAFHGSVTASDLFIYSNVDDTNLYIQDKTTGETITAQYHFAGDQLENITFGDGSSLNLSQINDLAIHHQEATPADSTFYGQTGDDTFYFNGPAIGNDTINGFNGASDGGGDIINLHGLGFSSFDATFQSHITYDLAHNTAVIALTGTDSITLYGVHNALTAGDFHFA